MWYRFVGKLSSIIWSLKSKLISPTVFVKNEKKQNEGDKMGGNGGGESFPSVFLYRH